MTGDIALRPVCAGDAEALLAIYAPYVLHTAVSFEYDVPDVEEFRGRIQKTLERYPYIAAQIDGELVGYAYAGPFKTRAAYERSAETSIYIRRDMKRRGVGRTLYSALEDMLRAQGVTNLNACIACPVEEDEYLTNDSARFHERLGFSAVGRFHLCAYKFSRWYDMLWMEKLIAGHGAEPPGFTPLPQLMERGAPPQAADPKK